MKVVITKKHTENTYFLDCDGCALHKAISEQYPSLILLGVAGSYIRTDMGKYKINSEYETGWNITRFNELQKGVIDKYEMVIYVPECDKQKIQEYQVGGAEPVKEQPKPKIKTVYVTLPQSITEQAKELVTNNN